MSCEIPVLTIIFRPLVKEANEDIINLVKFHGDMVERHYIRCLRGHAAKDSCEWCESCSLVGIHWEYPRTTRGRLRTHERFKRFAL